MKLVWDTAAKLTEGDYVTVEYWSKRAEGVREMTGLVKSVEYDELEGLSIEFRRDDGQTVVAKDDGKLYSVGSHFPNNGDIKDIEVKDSLF